MISVSIKESEYLQAVLDALEKMVATWKSGVPARRWNYKRVTGWALYRAGHW